MFNPRETYHAAGQRARHAERTGARLMFSVIGFSTAYFLDPEHGAARRSPGAGIPPARQADDRQCQGSR